MRFIVYQCTKDPDYFIVTDENHAEKAKGEVCPSGGSIEKIGEFAEMGDIRAAFDETIAKNSIEHQGFYLFEAPGFAPIPPAPEMPG